MEEAFGIIAGNGVYPHTMARSARAAGITQIAVAAFQNETDPGIESLADETEWMRVGQLGRLISFFEKRGIARVVMAGQINPANLFDLRPDMKALTVLARLKQRNAESIFGAIGDELAKAGVTLLPATTYMDEFLARPGLIAGPRLKPREEEDLQYGFEIAKAVSQLNIGQTVVVKNGTVLAVEAFEGTNNAIRRGGELGRKGAMMVKVSKPNQDLRFDVPVIGPATLQAARDAKLRAIGVEAGSTLLLEPERLRQTADEAGVSIFGLSAEPLPSSRGG